MMLDQVKEHITDAENAITGGTDRERVDAAGELILLIRQKNMIERRLAEIDDGRHTSEDLVGLIRSEMFNLSLRFRQLLTHT